MRKQNIQRVMFGLICLSLTACIGFQSSVEREPGVSQIEAAGSTPEVVEATEAPATATTISRDTAVDDGAAPPATVAETPAEEEPMTETVTPEPAPASGDAVYAERSGEMLALPGCYDFDEGLSLVPPDSACDFSVLPGPDGGTIEMYPQNGALLAYGGVFPEAPTLAQCAASEAYSREQEIVAPMAAMFVCYQTSEGRTGYLHFTAADLEKGGTVTFDWLTFK